MGVLYLPGTVGSQHPFPISHEKSLLNTYFFILLLLLTLFLGYKTFKVSFSDETFSQVSVVDSSLPSFSLFLSSHPRSQS